MSGLTEAERRGARLLAALLVLGTAYDLWQARHPHLAPEPGVAGSTEVAGPAVVVEREQRADSVGSAVPGRGLELNTATMAELDRLPGIGPVLAGRIVEHRRQHGEFRRVDELLTVPGIGPRLLERLRPWLREPPAVRGAPGILHGAPVQNAR